MARALRLGRRSRWFKSSHPDQIFSIMTLLPTICALGEILVDYFPDGKRLGGAPFNFITHMQRLSFPTMFVTRIGRDHDADEILQFLKKIEMDLTWIQQDDEHPTGSVTVHFRDDGSHSFTAAENTAQDYLVASEIPEQQTPKALFFGTFGQRHSVAAAAHDQMLSRMKGRTKLFCDLNIRPPFFTKEIVEQSLRFCDVLKISEEDISFLYRIFFHLPQNPYDVVRMLMDKYDIEHVYLTRGSEGSLLFEGNKKIAIDAAKANVVNTVGAGDAYSAIVVAGMVLNWESQMILERASIFSAAICEEAAAIPAKDEFYNRFKVWFS